MSEITQLCEKEGFDVFNVTGKHEKADFYNFKVRYEYTELDIDERIILKIIWEKYYERWWNDLSGRRQIKMVAFAKTVMILEIYKMREFSYCEPRTPYLLKEVSAHCS